jgi:hypothetical protein
VIHSHLKDEIIDMSSTSLRTICAVLLENRDSPCVAGQRQESRLPMLSCVPNALDKLEEKLGRRPNAPPDNWKPASIRGRPPSRPLAHPTLLKPLSGAYGTINMRRQGVRRHACPTYAGAAAHRAASYTESATARTTRLLAWPAPEIKPTPTVVRRVLSRS